MLWLNKKNDLQTRTILRAIFATAVALALLSAPAVRAAAPRDLKQLLPADTLVVIDVRDVPGLLEKWDASPFSRFYDDPRTEAFFRPVRDEIDSIRRRLGLPAERLRRFFSGQFVLAGIATGKSKNSLEWVMIARHNGDAQVLERLRRPPAPAGATLRRVPDKVGSYDITRLEVIRNVTGEIPTAQPRKKKRKSAIPSLELEDLGLSPREASPLTLEQQVSEVYEEYFGSDLIIHAGARGRPLARILERLAQSGDPDGAVAKPEFVRLRETLGAGADVELLMNAGALASAALKTSRKGMELLAFNPSGLGLQELQAVGIKVSLEPGRAVVAGALLSPAPRFGVARALFLPDGPAPDLAALIPAEAIGYTAIAMPLPKLWRVGMETLHMASPAVAMLVDAQFKGFEQGTGLKVAEALTGHLGAQVARFALPAGRGAETHSEETTMIALHDSAVFREALRALLQFTAFVGGYHMESDKSGRTSVWTLVEGAPNTPGAESGRTLLTLCVTNEWLLIGEGRRGIDAVLARIDQDQSPGVSLKTQPGYRQVAGQLPEGRFATAVLGRGALYKKAAQVIVQLATLAGERTEIKSGGVGLNGNRAPEPRVWDEFFGPAGAALSRQGNDLIRMDAFFDYAGK